MVANGIYQLLMFYGTLLFYWMHVAMWMESMSSVPEWGITSRPRPLESQKMHQVGQRHILEIINIVVDLIGFLWTTMEGIPCKIHLDNMHIVMWMVSKPSVWVEIPTNIEFCYSHRKCVLMSACRLHRPWDNVIS